MESEGRPFIELESVTHTFSSGIKAIRDVTASFDKGELVALIGQNGSGKTTLLKHLNGLLKPTSGIVKVNGIDSRGMDVSVLARTVGFVFQNPDHMIFQDSVEKEVAFGPSNLELTPKDLKLSVESAMSELQLESFRHRNPFLMGKGMRRKVTIASIISMRPEVLAIDEPTLGLDYRASLETMGFLKRFAEEGRTIIFSTHDMRLAADYAERVIVLRRGEVLADGPVRTVLSDEKLLSSISLRPPQITRLAQKLSELGVRGELLSVEELMSCLVEARRRSSSMGDLDTSARSRQETSSEIVLKTNRLFWKYNSTNWAIEDFNIEVKKGECVGIVGPTGAGKTTLLMCLAGLLPQSIGIMDGEVLLIGKKQKEFRPGELASKMGVVFEDPEIQFVASTVEDDIAFGLENLRMERDEINKRIKWALSATNLSGFEGRNPSQLSGGEKQRAALACILAMGQEVLLLDEPSAELDQQGKKNLFRVLSDLKEKGTTILIAEEDLEELALLLDRVILLESGAMRYDFPARVFFSKGKELVKYGVRPLEVVCLFDELKRAGIEIRETPLDENEAATSILRLWG